MKFEGNTITALQKRRREAADASHLDLERKKCCSRRRHLSETSSNPRSLPKRTRRFRQNPFVLEQRSADRPQDSHPYRGHVGGCIYTPPRLPITHRPGPLCSTFKTEQTLDGHCSGGGVNEPEEGEIIGDADDLAVHDPGLGLKLMQRSVFSVELAERVAREKLELALKANARGCFPTHLMELILEKPRRLVQGTVEKIWLGVRLSA
ncbi:hypothetical protein B0H14DRAFT_226215 [Mycena olivaceomarginata]|nr:hypothetical protein B0H14DRAFT_226215 [Mycena olivaceomarginata]